MPIIIKCKGCGEVIYIGHSIPSLKQFFNAIDKCNKCGRPFTYTNFKDIDVDVKPAFEPIDDQ